jgi:hypothetical protein
MVETILLICLVSIGGHAQSTPEVSTCDLYEHPEDFDGKLVKVKANVSYDREGNFWFEDYSGGKCNSYASVQLIVPAKVKPQPSFSLEKDKTYYLMLENLNKRRDVIATVVGRFDFAYAWHDKKKIRSTDSVSGFGKKDSYGMRIVLEKVVEFDSFQVRRPK